nr:proton channel OtopLc-like [Penaeus vannamei]
MATTKYLSGDSLRGMSVSQLSKVLPHGYSLYLEYDSTGGSTSSLDLQVLRCRASTYLWVVMSGMYGKLVVLLMLAFCLTEVLDNQVLPLTFQGIFLMYLYVGSIVAIMCIYVTVIADNCPSITASKENLTKNGDPEAGSITSFGTLKRAHISRSKTSRTSFYLRVGALVVFGLGTLIFNGLEIAMHSTMKGECVEDIVFAHPILQALFTFLQMHFLFVNSEVIVEKFGQVARFGFMHLVATNVAIWIRMWSGSRPLTPLRSCTPTCPWPRCTPRRAGPGLYSCFQNNSLGRLWTDARLPVPVPGGVQRNVFGLGTLIFNGLEIAMHSTMKGECVEDIVFAHPILQALFTFLQMHFLFVNSEVIVEKFGQVARFGFMHLVATNVAIWIRMVVWSRPLTPLSHARHAPGEVPPHAEQVLRLYSCFQNNSLGRLWTDAQPYLFPFLVEYSLIAAAVTYIMWCNVGKEKMKKLGHLGKAAVEDSATLDKRGVRKGYWKVDCRSASKGLFLGLLCLVGGIVILIMFFVMKNEDDFQDTMFWISNATQMIILGLAVISTVIGFLQIPKLSVSTSKPLDLDRLLLSTTIIGVYLFAVFGMIVGGINYTDSQSLATFCVHALLLVQVSLQGMLVAEASRRTCTSRYQMLTKPGRQVITFLLFANITLWILDTFMTHTRISQHFQFSFYGTLAWGIISRISVPLLILYRFHSAVILVEIWKNTYRTKAD